VKAAGRCRYVYRAIDQSGQAIDVFVSPRREAPLHGGSLSRPISTTKTMPSEVVTHLAPTYPVVLEERCRRRGTVAQPALVNGAGASSPGGTDLRRSWASPSCVEDRRIDVLADPERLRRLGLTVLDG
jgi:hypothetical protein